MKTGSRNETKQIGGLSHFLEHMVFKGSKKRPSAKEIAVVIDSIGGEFNAGTSKEWTNFYIKAHNEALPTAFDVLSDMVLNPLLKPEDIEREKGVILEELAMYEDTPMFKIGDVFENLIYKNSSLGRDIIGTRDSIKGVKRADFDRYRKIHYGIDNILITVAGGAKEKDIMKLAEKYFGSLKNNNKETAKKYKKDQKKPRVLLYPKKKEQGHFILGFLAGQMGNKDRFTESVLSVILGGGMSSRLFTEVREKRGLAYLVKTSIDRYVDTGYIGTYAGVDIKRIDEAIKVVLSEHYQIASGKNIISSNELKKAKEYIKGHLALSLEDTRAVGSFFGLKELLLGKIDTPEDVFKGIDGVTINDVLRVAKEFFVPERLNLAIIGPYKDQKRFEKLVS
ncbi:insulinase family protein [Patescibacteria group bacterium]|nr:insulinase family protein [Patescibacteria group bacterium]MBU0922963.1 insulinase family protein [Patescibacteria group bacterium]MBU1844584.1 insulinase family protein [Patescibacteria group bacterium]